MSIESGPNLSLLHAAGTPREIGVQLGRFGAAAVHGHLTQTRAWAGIVARSAEPQVRRMAELVAERFPGPYAELQGLAEGLGLPFAEVFAWNCRGDIWAMAPDGCTTVQVPGARRVIAHNEDGDPGFRGHCALARVVPAGGRAFTSFVYPGSLPGHTFAATDAGLVQTVNNIRAREAGDGLPRMVLTRAVLDCAGLDAALALLGDAERAGAFHLTLAQAGDPRLLSVEFAHAACSVIEVAAPSVHANHLVHADTADIPQVVTASSAARQRRGDALAADGTAGRDPLAVLRDRAGPDLPIRRDDPADPDDENTLATAVFLLDGDRLDWSVYDRAGGPACFHVREGVVTAG